VMGGLACLLAAAAATGFLSQRGRSMLGRHRLHQA
jgi:hypothetical protein